MIISFRDKTTTDDSDLTDKFLAAGGQNKKKLYICMFKTPLVGCIRFKMK
jgi:hypothetical protein